MDKKKRILIIGLDGFTWNLGRRFIAEGIMPNLAAVVQNSCHGKLKSVIPYETAPAWSSFQTGCYPEKTGIFAFHGYSKQTCRIKLNSFNEIRVPTIWELLSSAGKKVVSINMPMTSPPPQVNGVMIPGFSCPKLSKETVFPPDIYTKYIKPNPNYLIVNNQRKKCLQDYVLELAETENHRCNLAVKLMEEIDWDLFSVQIQSTDTFQHQNWWALDASARGFTKEDYVQATEFYKEIDSIVEKLIQAAGESVLSVIVSDHGFCSQKAEIGINTWLYQNGYLYFKDKRDMSSFQVFKNRLKDAVPPLKYLAKIYGKTIKKLSRATAFLDTEHKRKTRSKLYSEEVVSHIREIIDLDRTLAFCLGGMGEPLYIVNKKQPDKIDDMITQLLETYGPNSPEPLIKSICPVRTSNDGTASHPLPDYIVTLLPGIEARINPLADSVVKSAIIDNKQKGTHDQDGIFVLYGPQINSNYEFDADIVDIAPTLLSYLGIDVPDHMDGKILQSAFIEQLEVSYKTMEGSKKERTNYSNDDQSAVEKQLEDLGYL